MKYGIEAWNLALNEGDYLEFNIMISQEHRLYNLKLIEKIIIRFELERIEYKQLAFCTPCSNSVNFEAEIQESKKAYCYLLNIYNSFIFFSFIQTYW